MYASADVQGIRSNAGSRRFQIILDIRMCQALRRMRSGLIKHAPAHATKKWDEMAYLFAGSARMGTAMTVPRPDNTASLRNRIITSYSEVCVDELISRAVDNDGA